MPWSTSARPNAATATPIPVATWAPTSAPTGVRRTARANPVAASASVPPSSTRNHSVEGSPSQPAFPAPMMSSTSRPSETRTSDSAAARSPRRASHQPRPPVRAVKVTSVTVRPPTPMTDQVTARKTRAATSTHSAPRPSRICGTVAALSRERGGTARGGAAGAGVAGAGQADARSWVSRSSAVASVWNSREASSPCSGSPQASQRGAPRAIGRRQSGQRSGSAYRVTRLVMAPASHGRDRRHHRSRTQLPE